MALAMGRTSRCKGENERSTAENAFDTVEARRVNGASAGHRDLPGGAMPYRILRDQWFLAGVCLVTLLTLVNPAGVILPLGEMLASHHGNELCLVLIFLLSGVDLDAGQVREAFADWPGLLLALAAIFILAPALAWGLSLIAPTPDIALGLILAGVVSTTQASGIVMAAAAGGRAAHALLITVAGNVVCVVTIPFTLALLATGGAVAVRLPWLEMMLKLGLLILLPLLAGMAVRPLLANAVARLPFKPSHANRLVILVILFIGLSRGRENILGQGTQMLWVAGLAVVLHLLKAGLLWGILQALRWGPGRRESIFFMGIQKTLPQAIWLQSTYFAPHGMALVVCVVYHITQLVIDSWFVGRLGRKPAPLTVQPSKADG
jgi:solute carrier family 10 (sodium/bile acid cotransporter), member 7